MKIHWKFHRSVVFFECKDKDFPVYRTNLGQIASTWHSSLRYMSITYYSLDQVTFFITSSKGTVRRTMVIP